MFAKVYSSAVVGLDGVLVEVETEMLNGLPNFTIVGLPDKAVEESRERVRSALKNTNADLPAKKIIVSLAPGDLPKEGSSFDLPIAISILISSGQLNAKTVENSMFLGELSLDGTLRPSKGILPMILFARKHGIQNVFIPSDNIQEAAIVDGITIYPSNTLREIFLHLTGEKAIIPAKYSAYSLLDTEEQYEYDMKDIRGQEFVKRAIEVAVAGSHNILLKGPPGSGKTLIAKTVVSILPPLTFEEALEVTKIYSISGLLGNNPIMKMRPYRNPHHTTSQVGLIGGSANPRPGEISLAHRGVLFMDEFPEYPRGVLETMRQPMEDGKVVISRARDRVEFPARFMLVAAANPCPCGYFGDTTHSCSCVPSQILKYQKRLSGPILDRIDIHIDVPSVPVEKITQDEDVGVDSKTVRARVAQARGRQSARFSNKHIFANSEMTARDIKENCHMDMDAKAILKEAIKKYSLSARSYHKVIKIAQTIADLEDAATIQKNHILEALQYRPQMQFAN